MGSGNEIYMNLYGTVSSTLPLSGKNKVVIQQSSDYPVTGKAEINVNPDKAEEFTLALRIPAWSESSYVKLNDQEVKGAVAGSYLKITRVWNKYDKVTVNLDLTARLVTLNNHQAITRGPLVLARDNRFHDGYIYESAVIRDNGGKVELKPVENKTQGVWMTFTAPLVLGTDLEGEFKNPRQITFCDFASAGNTWGEDSRYKVWIPKTLNVMKADYKAY
jgi:DUF1680 family protein